MSPGHCFPEGMGLRSPRGCMWLWGGKPGGSQQQGGGWHGAAPAGPHPAQIPRVGQHLKSYRSSPRPAQQTPLGTAPRSLHRPGPAQGSRLPVGAQRRVPAQPPGTPPSRVG
uniref:Uncharacterized protein n=1 Tax=Gallus gallus TaxID=9031 RepID=A0A8V0X498_CHICK